MTTCSERPPRWRDLPPAAFLVGYVDAVVTVALGGLTGPAVPLFLVGFTLGVATGAPALAGWYVAQFARRALGYKDSGRASMRRASASASPAGTGSGGAGGPATPRGSGAG